MKQLILAALLIVSLTTTAQKNFSAWVNPFIGTGGHGHTYPGATRPFGMMQLSPDTRLEGWDGCGGYHYSDSLMYGFSHTHLSGTGVPDYCDLLVMPFTGTVSWKPANYCSLFSHQEEHARPGYYDVLLKKDSVFARLTTTVRAGMHEYQFPVSAKDGKMLIDLKHRDEVLESSLELINDHEIRGFRRSKSWAQNQYFYFYIQLEEPIAHFGLAVDDQEQAGLRSASGKNIKAYISCRLPSNNKIRMKVGISAVSAENARLNLNQEIPVWDFETIQSEATKAWNQELGKIEISGGTHDQQVVFYTALYHTMVVPNIFTDVNGEYRGTDLKIHQARHFTNYSVFSLWDTHRALHPLMTILQPKRTGDWINTFLAQYQYGGMLPVWELSGNETFCMIGYHSVPVIADAYQKGIRNFDATLALKAMQEYATSSRFGIAQYDRQGFLSNEADHESASKTVEYAYDDWCIAQFAHWLGKDSAYRRFLKRSLNYRNLFDPQNQHIRGKVQSFWFSPFQATEINNFFTEGNSWHYSFTAQQDLDGLINVYGGNAAFLKKLEELFTTTQQLSGRDQSDVTGLIGQYAHGNEPSHHMAYLFNYAGKPWRTQEIVHQICTEFYRNSPDGLIGNEDCGQMSAWFVLSAMGFYPVTPGAGEYVLGTPLFDTVTIHLENGKTCTLVARNHLPGNNYVNRFTVNGKLHPATWIRHSDILKGSRFEFEMSAIPNKQRGVATHNRPHSKVADSSFLPVPFFDMSTFKFKQQLEVSFKDLDPQATLYYQTRTDSSAATEWQRYTHPFPITHTTYLKAYAEKHGIRSNEINQKLVKVPDDQRIEVTTPVHPMYTAGGNDALIDRIFGTTNWKTGEWQSYFNTDFEAVVDLKEIRPVEYVAIHVLQDVSPWIVFPKEVRFEISQDGMHYEPLLTVTNTLSSENKEPMIQEMGAAVKSRGRYVRIHAVNGGPLPAWHESAGSPAHLFIDEVIIR